LINGTSLKLKPSVLQKTMLREYKDRSQTKEKRAKDTKDCGLNSGPGAYLNRRYTS
jgi:hypothetical protein